MPAQDKPRYTPITEAHPLFVGEDKTLRFTIYDRDAQTPKDITGWTLEWKLESSQGAAASVTKSGTVTDGPNGVCTVTLLAADTSGLTAGTYWHVLARTDTGSNTVLAHGPVALEAR